MLSTAQDLKSFYIEVFQFLAKSYSEEIMTCWKYIMRYDIQKTNFVDLNVLYQIYME